jgi:hypothetical protein
MAAVWIPNCLSPTGSLPTADLAAEPVRSYSG